MSDDHDAAPGPGSPYAIALALHTGGATREAIAGRLTELGLDEESVKVMLGSLPGAPTPSALPEAHLELSTNALAPRLFALADLGIEGDRRTVALYWMTFGLVFATLTTIALVAGHAQVFDNASSPWAAFALKSLPWVGYPLSAAALLRAVFLVVRR